ncbi:MAG: EscU/YscU/HrcU family type III secretion system export apparatus switch protein [unclassified Hahellaceae]|nr:EscU/YscU/HrcU family type III secretion system export apparatus switch protein [Hahellaceae bacterium]|tara:strand:+ start:34881 stop:35966 length:1086 start_codon:yes stop_codon:yes gene_type:complete
MSQDKGADQTEKPTPKRLRDAREDGQVSKSQDLSKTLTLLVWFGLLAALMPFLYRQISQVFELVFAAIAQPRSLELDALLMEVVSRLTLAMVPLMLTGAIATICIEFIQVGPLLAWKKAVPKLDSLNPAEGIKRMFSMKNIVEVLKAMVKTVVVAWVIYMVARAFLAELIMLVRADSPLTIFMFYESAILIIVSTLVVCFLFVSILDVAYQHYEFIKGLMMSMRDIKQEHKDSEGDPMIKGQRRELHQEWSQENQLASTRRSSAVVVNPTHIAVALQYTPDVTDLPIVVAKGEGYMAREIRQAAEQAGVPIVQNITLARGLFADVEIEHFITSEYFEPVAEVLRWAEEVREENDTVRFGMD